jgi:type VI secretion system protein ImpE
MTPQELYEAGQLREAIAAGTEEVRQHPADAGRRGFLCELLCFAGDYERADRQLDALGHQNPEAMTTISLLRHLIRAEQARQQFYTEGRLPEFLAPAPPWLRLHLEASIHLREKNIAEAMRLLTDAEAQRPKLSGVCDEQPFDDFRDFDDLSAGHFEVLTSNGKYYWIPMDRVEIVEFRPWRRPHDLLWRRAHMIVRDGPDGEVFLPTLYAGASAETDDRLRLGRMTEWRGAEDEPIRGVGQRTFRVGDEERPILELQTLSINQHDEPPA